MSRIFKCHEYGHEVDNFDNVLKNVNKEDIMCEICDEFITIHPGCVIVPRSE